ncbi:MAG: IS1380 family transposase, partial [Actinomycetota bacterium]|nr:IS1380 family transposase [Actinomycetota bacterium]
MLAAIGEKALERSAASSQTVSRFETEALDRGENLKGLSAINHAWMSKAMRVSGARKVIPDMDSSGFPVRG